MPESCLESAPRVVACEGNWTAEKLDLDLGLPGGADHRDGRYSWLVDSAEALPAIGADRRLQQWHRAGHGLREGQ